MKDKRETRTNIDETRRKSGKDGPWKKNWERNIDIEKTGEGKRTNKTEGKEEVTQAPKIVL